MKKIAYIIARKDIINPRTWKVHDDVGLYALDGIIKGEVKEFDTSVDDQSIMESLIAELEEKHPEFHADNYELKVKTIDNQ